MLLLELSILIEMHYTLFDQTGDASLLAYIKKLETVKEKISCSLSS